MVSRKRTKPQPAWHVLRLKASPAAFVGRVYAPDEKAALRKAIKEYNIAPAHRDRLLLVRQD